MHISNSPTKAHIPRRQMQIIADRLLKLSKKAAAVVIVKDLSVFQCQIDESH